MLVFVNTVTIADHDFVVNARFYHALSTAANGRRLELRLLGKRIAVSLRRPIPRINGERRIVYYLKQRAGRVPVRRRRRLRTITFVPLGHTTTTATAGGNLNPVPVVAPKEESKPVVPNLVTLTPPTVNAVLPEHSALTNAQEVPSYLQPLASEATSQQTAQWLQTHRFGSYLRMFASFSGADLLRLSRDDLIQICGLPDGIRLYNALHSKTIAPRLTMYLCVEQSSVYHALYLDSLSCAEMAGKLALLLGVVPEQVRDVYFQGPNGIHVLITDEVVRNFKDEAMFTIEILQDPSGEQYRLLLKPTSR